MGFGVYKGLGFRVLVRRIVVYLGGGILGPGVGPSSLVFRVEVPLYGALNQKRHPFYIYIYIYIDIYIYVYIYIFCIFIRASPISGHAHVA